MLKFKEFFLIFFIFFIFCILFISSKNSISLQKNTLKIQKSSKYVLNSELKRLLEYIFTLKLRIQTFFKSVFFKIKKLTEYIFTLKLRIENFFKSIFFKIIFNIIIGIVTTLFFLKYLESRIEFLKYIDYNILISSLNKNNGFICVVSDSFFKNKMNEIFEFLKIFFSFIFFKNNIYFEQIIFYLLTKIYHIFKFPIKKNKIIKIHGII